MMQVSLRGENLIRSFEGCRLQAYEDVVGVWTIGYGHTGPDVKPGMTITLDEATALLRQDLDKFEAAVESACTARAPNQNQFDAMVCFAYNVGIGGFQKSSVLRNHLAGDLDAAARAFGLWNKAGGKVWPGLTRRRAAEAALYMEPMDFQQEHDMPQEIEPEKPLAQSSINRTAVVTGVTAAAASASQILEAVNTVKTGADALGPWLVPVLLLAIVAGCGWIIWERVKQRKGGWA